MPPESGQPRENVGRLVASGCFLLQMAVSKVSKLVFCKIPAKMKKYPKGGGTDFCQYGPTWHVEFSENALDFFSKKKLRLYVDFFEKIKICARFFFP